MRARIWLQSIQVESEGDRLGRAEPFLWPLFFRLDARTLRHLSEPPSALAEDPVWLVAPDGAHRNLGGAWRAGETITIPGPLGRVVFELDSGGLLSNEITRVGFFVALLEEEIFPAHATIVKEYARFATSFEQLLRDRFKGVLNETQLQAFALTPPPPTEGTPPTLTFAGAQDIREQLSRYVLGGDALVGVRCEAWNIDELEARPYRTFTSRWAAAAGSREGSYTLTGEIQAEITPEGALAGCVWSVDRSPQIHFRSEGRHLHQVRYDGSGWTHQDLHHLSRGPERALPVAAVGDPVCLIDAPDHAQHLLYRGMDDHLHELSLLGGWRHTDLSAAAGAPPAAGNPAAWVRGTDGSAHIAWRGRDGHIHEIWHHHGRHHHRDVTLSAAGAPNALGDPAVYVRANGDQAIVFRGADGHLHVLAFNGQVWRHDDLGFSAHAPVAASDPVVVSNLETGLLALVYRGALGHICLLVHEADSWNPVDLSAVSHAVAATGRPTACLSEGAIFIAWRSLDGEIHGLMGEGTSWKDQDISQLAGCSVRAASDPIALAGGRDGALHVVFRGVDRHLHALSLAETWRHVDLSLASKIGF